MIVSFQLSRKIRTYFTLFRIYESLARTTVCLDVENRLMGVAGQGGKKRVEDIGESNMETYVTICKIDSPWEFAV